MNVERSPLVLPEPGPVLRPGAGLAIPTSDRLVAAADALRTACRTDAAPAELRPAARAAGLAWVDSLLDGFVLALAESARGRGAGRRTAATLRELADTIVGSGARRIDHAHATRFLGFVDDHLRPGPPATIAFAIEPALAVALTPALVAGPTVAPTVLATALHALFDATLTRFLDAPLALLSLGMVARTAVRLGRGAVASRVHGELGRAVHDPAAAARLQARLVGYVGP